jgi:hypothetical protein
MAVDMNRLEQTHISRGMLHDLFQKIESLEARVRQLEAELAEKSRTQNGFIVEAVSKQR